MDETRVVAAVLVRDRRVLVAQRAAHKREGMCWELPGGKVEKGETDGAALERELWEELGVRVQAGAFLGESVHVYPHGAVRLMALRCALVAGEPRALEHAAVRWVTADGLDALEWAPADVPLLPALRRALE